MRRRTFVAGAGATAGAAVGVGGASARRSADSDGSVEKGEETGSDAPSADEGDEEGDPRVIAHRGFAGLYPENTVAAVEGASSGDAASMIEIDVVPTGDGDVVVFHDSKLSGRDGGEQGLTDTDGLVWETPTEVVTDAEVLDSGETVPLLSDVLDAVPESVGVNVEFKNPGSSALKFDENLSGDELDEQAELWRPFTRDVLSVLGEYDHEFLVSSFYEAALATVRAESDLPVAPLLWSSIETGLEIAREYDAEAIHPPYNMIADTPFFGDPVYTEEADYADVDLVSVAHDEGREVNPFTLTTWYQAEQLAAAGVDGIIADYPGLLA